MKLHRTIEVYPPFSTFLGIVILSKIYVFNISIAPLFS